MAEPQRFTQIQEALRIFAGFELQPKHLYLLEIIPLIDILWADGESQAAEVRLIYWYAVKHLARLYSAMPQLEDQLSIEECNDFRLMGPNV